MIIGEEDFWFLLHNLAHWEFEIFLMVLFDGLLLGLLYPLFKKWLAAHDAKKHAHEHCGDIHDVEPDEDGLCSTCAEDMEWDDMEYMWFCPNTWEHG